MCLTYFPLAMQNVSLARPKFHWPQTPRQLLTSQPDKVLGQRSLQLELFFKFSPDIWQA